MSGVIIELFSKRTWTGTSLGASGTFVVPLVRALDVHCWTEGTMYLLSSAHTIPSGASFKLRAYTAAPSREEPGVDFYETGRLAAQITLSSSSPAAPTLLVDAVDANFGPWLYIDLLVTQASSPSTLTATLSGQLALKRRDWE